MIRICVRVHERENYATVEIHSNVTKDMKQTLKSLKEDDTMMVLPADKNQASVVLNTETYRQKMKTIIESGTHRLLNKDPTNSLS